MNIIIISKPVRYELRYISSNNNQSIDSSSNVFVYYDKKKTCIMMLSWVSGIGNLPLEV